MSIEAPRGRRSSVVFRSVPLMAPIEDWWPRLPVEPGLKVQQKSSPSTITSESLCFSIGFKSVTPGS